MLNINSAFGTSERSGNVARTIGTAPRSPTHETMVFSLRFILLKSRVIKTLMGRATNIKNIETNKLTTATEMRCDGKTSSPRIRNIAICINHASPSWNRIRLFLRMKSLFPTITPARYTARNPFPPSDVVAP